MNASVTQTEERSPEATSNRAIWIVYDGECPFCQSYVRLVRLRESVGTVHLIDARTDHPVVTELKSQAFDLDEGMALKVGNEIYHGHECMHQLALLSSPSNFSNRMHYWIFSNATRAKYLYPYLRASRNAALRLLGKRKIGRDFRRETENPPPSG